MITLFHRPKTRSTRFIFLLEELGAPYEIREVTIRSRDGTGTADPANPHPHGKVPAITDSETGDSVYESPAIALYLTDKFPDAGLGPTIGQPGRGAYLSWLAYYGSVLEPSVMSKFQNTPVPRGTAGWVPIDEVMEHVLNTLTKTPYLLGEAFSAADILYGTSFAMFRGSPLIPESSVLDGYIDRVLKRPAYARMLEKDGAQ